jgi:DivIVA domain-containing protein
MALAAFAGGWVVAIAGVKFGGQSDSDWGVLPIFLWAQAVILVARWFRFSKLLRRPGPARGATVTACESDGRSLTLELPGDGHASSVEVRLLRETAPEVLLPGESVTFYGRADGVGAVLVSSPQWGGTFLGTGKRRPASPAARETPPRPGHAGVADWIEARQFSTTRLRPGYDKEEVDAFLEAIRDTFAGVREPPLTTDAVRDERFSTTRLRPGYDEEEVDAFLDEVEARLPARCAECEAPIAGPSRACAECGAPPVRQPSAAAGPAPDGPGDSAMAAARETRSIPGRARLRYFLMCLICYLILIIGFVVAGNAPVSIEKLRQLALSYAMGWIIGLSLGAAILSLALTAFFTPHRRSPRLRQVAWLLVPVLSLSWLAFAPFLWLADIRRRGGDWAVFAAYLAAVAAEMYFIAVGYSGSVAWDISYSMLLLVGVTAAVHARVAFRPAARVPTWYDVHAVRDGDEYQPLMMDAVIPKDRR